MFPVEAVPDGNVWAPHHATYGLLAALFVVAVVWDDYRDVEPATVAVACIGALFGFLMVWPWYPAVGASMAVGGCLAALVGLLWPGSKWWAKYPDGRHAVAVTAVLVAADDVVNHAFGIPSPLDTGWKVLGVVPSAVVAVVAVAVAFYAIDKKTHTQS